MIALAASVGHVVNVVALLGVTLSVCGLVGYAAITTQRRERAEVARRRALRASVPSRFRRERQDVVRARTFGGAFLALFYLATAGGALVAGSWGGVIAMGLVVAIAYWLRSVRPYRVPARLAAGVKELERLDRPDRDELRAHLETEYGERAVQHATGSPPRRPD